MFAVTNNGCRSRDCLFTRKGQVGQYGGETVLAPNAHCYKPAVSLNELWTFRDLTLSRVVLSRPMFGPFATRYFSHPFDPSRFATSVVN